MAKRKQPDNAIPAGWGFRTVAEPVEVAPSRGQLYDFEPGQMAAHAGNPLFLHFVQAAFTEQVELFEESGDDTHLWRAWRAARCLGGDMPAAMLSRLLPHLDTLAKAGAAGGTRVDQRQRRDNLLRRYNTMMDPTVAGLPPVGEGRREAVLRRLARSDGTSTGAIEQAILKAQADAEG